MNVISSGKESFQNSFQYDINEQKVYMHVSSLCGRI